jgi:hypothetical protein
MRQEFARLADDRRITFKGCMRFPGCLRGSIVLRGPISNRSLLRFAIHAEKRLIPGVREREKTTRPLLRGRSSEGRQPQHDYEQEYE